MKRRMPRFVRDIASIAVRTIRKGRKGRKDAPARDAVLFFDKETLTFKDWHEEKIRRISNAVLSMVDMQKHLK